MTTYTEKVMAVRAAKGRQRKRFLYCLAITVLTYTACGWLLLHSYFAALIKVWLAGSGLAAFIWAGALRATRRAENL